MPRSSSEPPSGFGLPLYEAGDPDLDIIAVHGIGAHREWTWSLRGVNWLSATDMLPRDFPRARIMAYGYASNWLGKDAMSTCLDAVAGRLLNLVHELRKASISDCPDRNIIFIAHCFGGIVIEKAILKALVNNSDQDRSMLGHISGIVLLGTPHRGSASAGLANIVAAIAAHLHCGQKSLILESVSRDSQMLADTVREFARKAFHFNLRIHCFYEERETDIGAVVRSFIRVTSKTILVDRDSACLQGHGETALTLDHFRLNKFATPDDANYTLVRRVLQEMERATGPQVDHLVLKCMEDLYIGDPEYQIRGIEQRWGEIPPHSYEWIANDTRFQDWQKNDHRRVLWISGGTRTDRTMLMVGIPRELSHCRRQPLAYFFCEHGNCGSSVSILRSLIWRLVHVCPTLGRYLREYVSHGRRLSGDMLEPQVLSFLLSQMLRDANIPPVYLLVDSLEKCTSGLNCFQKLIEETASNGSSKAKWVISSCLVVHTPLTQTGRAVDLRLKDSTLSFALQTFKPCTMNEMTEDQVYCYRIQGFFSSCVAEQAREMIFTLISAEEKETFDPKIRMIPNCNDRDGGLTALLTTDRAPHFLYYLDYNPHGDYQLDIDGERLKFDRHFFGFTQLSAPPPSRPINADVIAINGLNEHAYASWGGDRNSFGQIWLQDFLGKDLPHCRVLTYGYNPNFSTRGISAMDHYCTEFLDDLKTVRRTAEEASRPLILVGHGFGSIIIAQTLIQAKEREEDGDHMFSSLYDSLKAMIFFAIPKPTMLIDDIQTMVAGDTTTPSPNLIEEVNDALQRLTQSLCDFKMYLQGRKVVNLVAAQQAGNSIGAFGGVSLWSISDKFVQPWSPLLEIPSFASSKIRVCADPPSIARFRTASDPAYQSIVKILREVDATAVRERSSGWINAAMVQQSGLTILHDPPDAIADIVLIPGLAGDPWETWSPCSRSRAHHAILGKFWPASFLPNPFPEARILVWGFEPDSKFQMGAFLDRASALLHTLTISSSRPLGRSMVFIAHSLGGILLKEMLRLADKGESMVTKDMMRYTSSIIFLGTPHSGDGNALSFCSVVQHMTAGDTTQFAGQELDARLEECQETFLTQRQTYDFRVKCFAEIPDPAFQSSGRQSRYIVPRVAMALEGLNVPVENVYASPPGFCRFEDEYDPEYRKIATEVQISLDHIKAHELHLRDDCLKSLHFEQLQSRELDITTALKSTGTWLFEHGDYIDWDRWDVVQSEQRRGLLWIRGQPGSGKSTLMKMALTQAKDKGRRSSFCVSGFFFTIRSNVQLQKSPLGLFRTLLHDLIQQDKALLTAFITQYKKKDAANFGPWTWHQKELQDFFKSAYLGREFPDVKKAMIFIDALDESDKEGHRGAYQVARELVFYFREISAGQKLKVCLSSRHYPEIEVPDCPQIAVENFNIDDIKRFLTTKLRGASEDSRIKTLAGNIAGKANGVFLWVILVVESLNMSLANHMTDKGLDEALSDLPGELEGLFESLFTSTTSKHELQVAATIFQWVLLAQRPLEKDELRHALTIDCENMKTLENACDWNLSEDCMPGDPEKFLTSLRFYTRGLAQIVLKWDAKPPKRSKSSKSISSSPSTHSFPYRLEESRFRKELEERKEREKQKEREEQKERDEQKARKKQKKREEREKRRRRRRRRERRERRELRERARGRDRERARERAKRTVGDDEEDYEKAICEEVDGEAEEEKVEENKEGAAGGALKEVEDGPKVYAATITSLHLLSRPYEAPDTEKTNRGRSPHLPSPRPSMFSSSSESSSEISPETSPESSPVSSRRRRTIYHVGHLAIPNNPYRPTIIRSAPSPSPSAGRSALTNISREHSVSDAEDSDTAIIKSVSSCSPVQLIHESVREFFLRGQGFAILEGNQHSKSLAERHEILAQYCMACICQDTILDSDGKYYKIRSNTPFSRYASQALFYHLDRAACGDRVPQSVIQALFAADQRLWESWRVSTYHYGRDRLCEDILGFAPFHFLCRKRMLSSASSLLALGVDVNAQDSEGNSALHYAVSDVAIDAIHFLTNKQANLRIKNVKGETPLHRAVRCEAPESALTDLLRPFVTEAMCLEDTDGDNLTPLHAAARSGNAAAARILLTHRAQVNVPTGDGWTALHLAVHFYHPKAVEHLLAAGAEVNALTPQREAPIHLAATKPSISLLGSLIRYGADLNAIDSRGRTPIHIRVLQGLRIGLLLASGANMEARTPLDKQTPLHLAVSSQNYSSENLMALLDAGADRNAVDWQGKTPLHYAAENLHVPAACVQRLLQGGGKPINLSVPDRWKRTPLHYAAQRSDLHVFRLLMEAGADLTKEDVNNATPVHYARGKIDQDHYLRHLLESKGYKRVVRYIGSQLTATYDAPNASR